MSFRKLLVPHDFSAHSDAALSCAVELAKALRAEVHLVHVHQPPIEIFDAYGVQPVEPILQEIPKAAATRLERELDKLRKAGVAGEARVREGAAAEGICDEASNLGADLIVMGTHGHTGIQHVLLGSIAERTVRLAPCPVLTVKVDARK